MRIVIATPSYPPRVGGPSHYAKGLYEAWIAEGHEVGVVSFSDFLKQPSGIRHGYYLLALLRHARSCDVVCVLDTFSSALPAFVAGVLLRKKVVVRISGDFIWEGYVQRVGELLTLQEFYAKKTLPLKERVLFMVTKYILAHAHGLIFQNRWQQSVVGAHYHVLDTPHIVIQNCFPKISVQAHPKKKNFVWAGRPILLKNVALLERAFARAKKEDPTVSLDIYTELPREELFAKMKEAYAVICPSLSDMNPNLILEGLQFGRPFISTTETGIREVTEGMGIFVNPHDESACVEAILSLAHDEVYEGYVARIRSRVDERTYQDIARECLAFFQSL